MSIYYTIKGKDDGFGAQYQAILSGISYCNYKNYIYIHTPFTQIDHAIDVSKANEFIGIHNNLEIDSSFRPTNIQNGHLRCLFCMICRP